MTQFADHFLVESSRLKNWDYSTPGVYFITICTYLHNKFFGEINNDQIILSDLGIIAQQCLVDIPKHFSNVELIESVVMPNHVHVLLKIKHEVNNIVETRQWHVSTEKELNNIHKPYIAISHWKPKSISSIVNQYKSIVTKQINPRTIFFSWQPRFYDEIIKDENRLKVIKYYIKNNPKNWQKDKLYK